MTLVRITRGDFSIDEEIERVKAKSTKIGGIAIFLGTVRDVSKGENVENLRFEHYDEMALKMLEEIRGRALHDFDVEEIIMIHRIGELSVGDNIVLIVVGARHRSGAFKACQWCIDELKKIVPIWKKEVTSDAESWVGGF
jgi:molybdopterin synthase catalytic subunit